MSTMHDVSRPVNLDSLDWPAWTDSGRWELGPDPSDEDAAWWATHCPGNADGYDVEDEDLDEGSALEAAAVDSLSRGLIPPDVAEMVSRTSLVGLADSILHRGADPDLCLCEPCVWGRTRRYAD